MKLSSFHIYDASAGSGKTFTLVKEYLKVLLTSQRKEPYKYILAITFTNKAVGEMKARIIETLKLFSDETILEKPNDLFNVLVKELSISPNLLHLKSKEILQRMVHNYAAFDVSTIDKFNQRLIRTFAYDLKLPLNFEVELDTDAVLSEAIDNLIAKAGSDETLTKVLIDFAIEKADDDKSWDVAYDFNQMAKILTNENDLAQFETLKSKTLDDFNSLKKKVRKEIATTQEHIVANAKDTLELISESGLEHSDFNRSTLPNHFIKASQLKLKDLYKNKLEENITERKGLYSSKIEPSLAETIEAILPQIEARYGNQKQLIYHLLFLNTFYKNITPLSVLNSINQEVIGLKEEQNILLISEFNNIISTHIKEQPAPFIYERIGEKFKHYFIDEFQDTSILQWENLIPLIDNAVSGEHASAMLVGDAKQAIYRWRGGKAEQFIELSNSTNPFQTKKEVHHLDKNYRSFKTIVDFNNAFFKHLSNSSLNNQAYKALYAQSHQNKIKDQDGFVNITFLNTKDEDKDVLFSKQVLQTINQCLQRGFTPDEMCVLVRKKKEGIAISNYLNEHSDITIMSSESLLISNSSEVTFIVNLLQFILEPTNKEVKVKVLHYLAENKFGIDDKHLFFESFIHLNINQFFNKLEHYTVFFNYNQILELSLYEAIEVILHDFNLVEISNAYVQYFLDFALDYMQKHQSSILGFLEYYQSKKDSLSIISPDTINAVQVMTIHKAKGLEFPVVIFPYADLDIYYENRPKAWFQLDPKLFNGFEKTLINYTKDVALFGEQGASLYAKHQAELELDNINLLYVALTRAVEQLYVLSEISYNTKGEVKELPQRYSGFFISYLKQINLWNNDTLSYSFGTPEKTSKAKQKGKKAITQSMFISTPKKDLNINVITSSGLIWDTAQEQALERGNLVHHILSLVKVKTDIDFAFNQLITAGTIDNVQAKELKTTIEQIVNHEQLSSYFSSDYTIYNEQDIISKKGTTIRPDRLMLTKTNDAIILDYKTGKYQEAHRLQLLNYKTVIEEMNISVLKMILVYVNTEIELKEM